MKKLAIEYLLATKDRWPGKTAVVDQGKAISFSELWRRGVELGQALKVTTRQWNAPVVIDIDKAIEAIVAMVGVQISGNIYVPFDVETPKERRKRVLDALGPHFVLEWSEGGYRLGGEPIGPGPDSFPAMEASLLAGLKARTNLDPVYVTFTSGSTGVPKGVTIANASVIDYIDWARKTYGISEKEVIGSQAPFYFDNSVLDLYLTFASGCTLHLLPKDCFVFLPMLLDYLKDHAVSFIFFVPSLLSNIAALNLLDGYPLPDLHKILFAGEAMPPSTLAYLRGKLPHALLSNLYGPTEATVDCIYWIFGSVIDGRAAVPLGVPCENTEILFLDAENRIVEEPDTSAEICVGGVGVSLGYWNDAEKTQAAFIQNPRQNAYREIIYKTGDLGYRSSKDGLIYTTGRKDDQIKHLGNRIELGEVQSALNRVPGIVQSSVEYDYEKKAIVAFYCAGGGGEIAKLREILSSDLPAYMLPREFIRVETIPFTSSGKVDREALLELRKRRRAAKRP